MNLKLHPFQTPNYVRSVLPVRSSEEAAADYNTAAMLCFGEFASLNIIGLVAACG